MFVIPIIADCHRLSSPSHSQDGILGLWSRYSCLIPFWILQHDKHSMQVYSKYQELTYTLQSDSECTYTAYADRVQGAENVLPALEIVTLSSANTSSIRDAVKTDNGVMCVSLGEGFTISQRTDATSAISLLELVCDSPFDGKVTQETGERSDHPWSMFDNSSLKLFHPVWEISGHLYIDTRLPVCLDAQVYLRIDLLYLAPNVVEEESDSPQTSVLSTIPLAAFPLQQGDTSAINQKASSPLEDYRQSLALDLPNTSESSEFKSSDLVDSSQQENELSQMSVDNHDNGSEETSSVPSNIQKLGRSVARIMSSTEECINLTPESMVYVDSKPAVAVQMLLTLNKDGSHKPDNSKKLPTIPEEKAEDLQDKDDEPLCFSSNHALHAYLAPAWHESPCPPRNIPPSSSCTIFLGIMVQSGTGEQLYSKFVSVASFVKKSDWNERPPRKQTRETYEPKQCVIVLDTDKRKNLI